MKPSLDQPLIQPTSENTHPVDVAELQGKYPDEKIDDLKAFLHYKKNPSELPKNEDSNYPILYVFRHGETTDNKDMVFSGWRNVDLTPEGIKQAEILSEKLKNKQIQMLICSDQLRSIRTMEIALSKNEYAKKLEIHQDKRLRERCYGDLQGQSKLKWKLEKPELTQKYRRSWDNSPPNGESLKMVTERVREFLDEIIPLMQEQQINVALSVHGNSIRGIRMFFENLSQDETSHLETPLGQDYAAYSIK